MVGDCLDSIVDLSRFDGRGVGGLWQVEMYISRCIGTK